MRVYPCFAVPSYGVVVMYPETMAKYPIVEPKTLKCVVYRKDKGTTPSDRGN